MENPGFSFFAGKGDAYGIQNDTALCLVLFILAGLGFLFVRTRKK